MSIVIAVMAYFIQKAVAKNGERQSRFLYKNAIWAEQQQINLMSIQNANTAELFERMVYGDDYNSEGKEQALKFLHIFLMVNKMRPFCSIQEWVNDKK